MVSSSSAMGWFFSRTGLTERFSSANCASVAVGTFRSRESNTDTSLSAAWAALSQPMASAMPSSAAFRCASPRGSVQRAVLRVIQPNSTRSHSMAAWPWATPNRLVSL